MSKARNEMLLIGGACILAPVVACAIAIPLFMVTKSAILTMVIGTITAMAMFVIACLLHVRLHRDDSQEDERLDELDSDLGSPRATALTAREPAEKI